MGIGGGNRQDTGRPGARDFGSSVIGDLRGLDGPDTRGFSGDNREDLGEPLARGFCGDNAESVGGAGARDIWGVEEGALGGLSVGGFGEGIEEGLRGVARGCNRGDLGGPNAGSNSFSLHNDLHKTEVEYMMEQIKILQKTVENYKLECTHYKKQVNALEIEMLSILEKHKCQLEEKLAIVSGLEKVASDDHAEEINNGNIDDENDEESKYKKNLEQLNQAKNSKRISLPPQHGNVICSLKAILAGGKRADFTLKSGSFEWPVHRAILEGRIGHFETLFLGEWADTGKVQKDDVTEGALNGVLQFVYAGEVGDMSVGNVCRIYDMAYKFLLRDLKSLCIEYMKRRMCPEMVCGALIIGEIYGERDLKESALECYFRESYRVVTTQGWKEMKANHPAIIAELFREVIQKEGKNQRKE